MSTTPSRSIVIMLRLDTDNFTEADDREWLASYVAEFVRDRFRPVDGAPHLVKVDTVKVRSLVFDGAAAATLREGRWL